MQLMQQYKQQPVFMVRQIVKSFTSLKRVGDFLDFGFKKIHKSDLFDLNQSFCIQIDIILIFLFFFFPPLQPHITLISQPK